MSFDIINQLQQHLSSVIAGLYGSQPDVQLLQIQQTKKEFEGDYTVVTFPFTKLSKKSPEETGREIGEALLKVFSEVEKFNVVKGFLNLSIRKDFWNKFLLQTAGNPDAHFKLGATGKKFMVEYSSPNTNKPLHLGHVRNILLGYSVAQILQAAGNDVIKVNLVNDRGIHICKSMLAWKKFGNGETPESAKMKGDHLVGKYYVIFDKKYKEQIEDLKSSGMPSDEAEKKAPLMLEVQEMLRQWEAGDAETKALWKMMNDWVYAGFNVTYSSLGVDFNKYYYESNTYLLGKEIIEEGLSQKVFSKKEDGSVRIDLTDVGLDDKVLLRSDGTSVYITQDLGTANQRFQEYPDLAQLIYTVGNEQDYHFKVLIEIFRKMKKTFAGKLFHLSYGMVDLPHGKMKSREGTVVDADELITEITEAAEMATKALGKLDDYHSKEAHELYHHIGLGALKYFILKVDPKKRMLFNPAESIDLNGNTGPFIQYTHARICSVLRKGQSYILPELDLSNYSFSEAEKQLIHAIFSYRENVQSAANGLSPALIANYAYETARAYNHFYHDHVVVDELNKISTNYRLKLTALTRITIEHCLNLLGIHAPKKM